MSINNGFQNGAGGQEQDGYAQYAQYAGKQKADEYLKKLDKALRKLPDAERGDALEYYAELFAEAGYERADEIIARLGKPKQLAATILADAAMRNLDEGKPRIRKGISAVWFGVLGVFAAPIALPVAIALFAVLFAVLISILAVLFALCVSAIAIVGSGIFTFIMGLAVIPQDAGAALSYTGYGLFLIAFGVLFCIFSAWLFYITMKGIAKLFNKMRRNKSQKEAAKYGTAAFAGTPPASAGPDATAAEEAQGEETPKKRKGRKTRNTVIVCGAVLIGSVGLFVSGYAIGGFKDISFGPNGIQVYSLTELYAVEAIDYSFEEISGLEVDLSHVHNVIIQQGSGSEVTVTGNLQKSQLDRTSIKETNGVLEIIEDKGKSGATEWFSFSRIGLGDLMYWIDDRARSTIIITVPQGTALSDVLVMLDTGDTKISDLNGVSKFTAECDIGDIDISNVSAAEFSVTGRTGDMTLEGISTGAFQVRSDIGEVTVTGLVAKSGSIESSTGNVSLQKVKSGSLTVSADIGDIEIADWDLTDEKGSTTINSDTGSITIVRWTALGEALVLSDIGDVDVQMNMPQTSVGIVAETNIGEIEINDKHAGSGVGSYYKDQPADSLCVITLRVSTGDIDIVFKDAA